MRTTNLVWTPKVRTVAVGAILLLATHLASAATLSEFLFDQGTNSGAVLNSVPGGDQPVMQNLTANTTYNLHLSSGGKYATSTGMMYIEKTGTLYGAKLGATTIPNWTSRSTVTLEAWVRPELMTTGTSMDVVNYNGLLLRVNKNGSNYNLVGGVYHGPTPGWTTTTNSAATIPFDNTTWTHIAMTYDGANIQTFVNGVLQITTACTGTLYPQGQGVVIGAMTTTGSNPYYGGIDEIRLSDVVLPAAQLGANGTVATAAMPTFSPAAGAYFGAQNVTISCATPSSTVYYTTDGSDPTTSSPSFLNSGTIAVGANMKLKAFAAASGLSNCYIQTASYIIKNATVDSFYEAIDNLAVSTIDNTTATTTGGSWMVFGSTSVNNKVNVINDPVAGSSGHGKVLQFLVATGGAGNLELREKLDSPTNRKLIWSFDIAMMGGNSGSFSIRTKGAWDTQWETQTTAYLADSPTAHIQNNNNGTNTLYNALTTFSYNKWYHVAITVYPVDHTGDNFTTYDFLMTRESDGATIFNLTGLPGRSKMWMVNDLQYLVFIAADTGLQTVCLDNVRVTVNPTDLPTFSPDGGNITGSQDVVIGGNLPAGSNVYVTTDGSDPTGSLTPHATPYTLTLTQPTIVKAFGVAPGANPSFIKSSTYAIPVAKPTFSPGSGIYSSAKTVTISCATTGSVIHYTTDGSDPTTSSPTYTAPITISTDNTTLKAKAWVGGIAMSSVGSAVYYLPASFDRPAMLSTGTVTIDGSLTDWDNASFAPIDQVYDNTSADNATLLADVPEAYYAAKWDASGQKLYVAAKVRDTSHGLTDFYAAWNQHDGVEIYVHTTGMGPNSYLATEADAQQYVVAITTSGTSVWTSMYTPVYPYGTSPVPAFANFNAAGSMDGDWLCYEVAITPFDQFSQDGSVLVPNTLHAGDVVGLDVVVTDFDAAGFYRGQLAENTKRWKSQDYMKFGVHKLGLSNSDLAAVLAAMDSKTGGPGWNANVDYDGDGEITSSDLSFVLANLP